MFMLVIGCGQVYDIIIRFSEHVPPGEAITVDFNCSSLPICVIYDDGWDPLYDYSCFCLSSNYKMGNNIRMPKDITLIIYIYFCFDIN